MLFTVMTHLLPSHRWTGTVHGRFPPGPALGSPLRARSVSFWGLCRLSRTAWKDVGAETSRQLTRRSSDEDAAPRRGVFRQSSPAGRVQTVLGPVAPEALGITLPHEHLFLDLRFLFRDPPPGRARGHERQPIALGNLYEINYDWFSNLDNLSRADEATAVEEAGRFRQDGGQTLVDPTTVGIGHDPLALRRVARATGLLLTLMSMVRFSRQAYRGCNSHRPSLPCQLSPPAWRRFSRFTAADRGSRLRGRGRCRAVPSLTAPAATAQYGG
jgi:Phosphotriesterase family